MVVPDSLTKAQTPVRLLWHLVRASETRWVPFVDPRILSGYLGWEFIYHSRVTALPRLSLSDLVSCVLCCFCNNLLDPLRPRRGAILQESRYPVLDSPWSSLILICPSDISCCLESMWLLSQEFQVSGLDCISFLHVHSVDSVELVQGAACLVFPSPSIALPLCIDLHWDHSGMVAQQL